MVGKRADRARDRRSVYDFLPAAPKRDNVINIVNVVGRVGTQHRSRRFCLSAPTATKSRFYLEGQIESSATFSLHPFIPRLIRWRRISDSPLAGFFPIKRPRNFRQTVVTKADLNAHSCIEGMREKSDRKRDV